jgi:hypothetical protein
MGGCEGVSGNVDRPLDLLRGCLGAPRCLLGPFLAKDTPETCACREVEALRFADLVSLISEAPAISEDAQSPFESVLFPGLALISVGLLCLYFRLSDRIRARSHVPHTHTLSTLYSYQCIHSVYCHSIGCSLSLSLTLFFPLSISCIFCVRNVQN